MMSLTKEQIGRYGRQLILPQLGVAGQQRLLGSSALIVGAGGLGCPAALYLAAAGVGRLGILDSDAVELTNLHRQILHATESIGQPKALSARTRLAALNPDIRIDTLVERLDPSNVSRLVEGYDVVLDGSDNFPTRYLVNDACVLAGKPLIHAGVVHFQGQLMVIRPRHSACFRCVFPEPPDRAAIPSCQEAGVLGAVAGVLGALMAQETVKVLTGLGEPITDRMLLYDGLRARFRDVPVRRATDCAVCGERPTIHEPVTYAEPACRAAAGPDTFG